jgi:hypothetical protein
MNERTNGVGTQSPTRTYIAAGQAVGRFSRRPAALDAAKPSAAAHLANRQTGNGTISGGRRRRRHR